ncbi:MAG: hypothetical protein AB7S71_24555 [Dongiaceae bacterium]
MTHDPSRTVEVAPIHYASRLTSTLAAKHIRVNTVSPGNTYFEGSIWQKIERTMPDLFKTVRSERRSSGCPSRDCLLHGRETAG